MKKLYSIRLKFIAIYVFSILVPLLVIMILLPRYLNTEFINEMSILIDNSLQSVSENVASYLDDLNRLTVMPYYDTNFIRSMKIKLDNKDSDISDYDILQADTTLKMTLPNYLMNTRKDISSTIVVSGSEFITGARKNGDLTISQNYDFRKQNWYIGAENANGKPYVLGIHKQDYFSDNGDTKVFSIARLIKEPITNDPLAVVLADANTSVFDEIFSKMKFSIPTVFVLLDESDNILYSSSFVPDDAVSKMKNNAVIGIGSNAYYVKVGSIDNYNWKIVLLLSYSNIKAKILWIYQVCAFFSLAGLLITFLVFSIQANDITDPIHKMKKVMKEVEKGNFDARVSYKKRDEIGELCNALDNMVGKLKQSIDKEYKLVIQQKNAEFRALSSQIHPHFLYNTLNGFIGLNRIGEKELLEKSIFNLTGMLRYALKNIDLVHVEDEFNFLKKYCDLQLLRFEERMKVDISCDEKIKNYMIPKFLLQPLVENAIIHGVEPSDKLCTISIYGREKDGLIIFGVKDDGIGFDADSLNRGVGISNIETRLNLFNMKSRLCIESSPSNGTHIEILIPKEGIECDNSNS